MWSFAPHDISVILALTGHLPLQATATGGAYLQPNIADVTVSNLLFDRGTRAHVFVSWLHPYKEQRMVVIGSRQMLVFEDTRPENKLVLFDKQIEWKNGIDGKRQGRGESRFRSIAMNPCGGMRCTSSNVYATRQAPRTPGEEGVRVLQVLQACQRSLQMNGEPVQVEADQRRGRWRAYKRRKMEAREYFVHESSYVDQPCEIGAGTKIWHFSHIMKNCRIGERCNIGQNVVISPDVMIGRNVKIQNNVSVYTGVILEDDVFCGPSMVFTNVVNPRSHVIRRDEYKTTLVKRGASLGANSTVVCGITIGRYAFAGAGAVLTHDVPDYALVAGNPARVRGWMCACGIKLQFAGDGEEEKAQCGACGCRYIKRSVQVSLLE